MTNLDRSVDTSRLVGAGQNIVSGLSLPDTRLAHLSEAVATFRIRLNLHTKPNGGQNMQKPATLG